MTTIVVLGLGYIGLPTACMFAIHGMEVVGVDVNSNVVKTLSNGGLHIEEAGLLDVVHQSIASGRLTITNKPTPSDVYIIAVPTPINANKTADMSAVISATESILPLLRKGNLVVLESTSPPGTTVNLVRPILEQSGLVAGKDFKLAYSPERVLPGRIIQELVANPRVIGGIDEASAAAGRDLYSCFVEGRIVLTDATTAEMVKLMENTFRDVNIALANEFALIAEEIGVDVWEAINIANHHPRVKIMRPGPGVGGHCIAVDPWFLVEAAPTKARLIRQARMVNDCMPHHVVELVECCMRDIEKPVIACLGLAYKANVDDIRESPSIEVARLLMDRGFELRVCDPHVSIAPDSLPSLLPLAKALEGADCAVLLTDHKEFENIPEAYIDCMRHPNVIDARGFWNSRNPIMRVHTNIVLGVGSLEQQIREKVRNSI